MTPLQEAVLSHLKGRKRFKSSPEIANAVFAHTGSVRNCLRALERAGLVERRVGPDGIYYWKSTK